MTKPLAYLIALSSSDDKFARLRDKAPGVAVSEAKASTNSFLKSSKLTACCCGELTGGILSSCDNFLRQFKNPKLMKFAKCTFAGELRMHLFNRDE